MRHSWALCGFIQAYVYKQLGGFAVDKHATMETALAEVLEILRRAENVAPPAHANFWRKKNSLYMNFNSVAQIRLHQWAV